jgi:UDP-N-acetylmuramoyl-tripeptide--D-alanyl-D-alanine ligase
MKELFKTIIVTVLEREAELVLKKYKPKIVAVTGSVGKTSTKDAIYHVLSQRFCVRKSQKSFNSDIGVPLTILGCPNGWNNPLIWIRNLWKGLWLILWKQSYPEWLVLEVGADRPGDIEKVSSWVKPDAVVVTCFGTVPVHVEYFKSVGDLIKEKSFLVRALKPSGILILNGDDADTSGMAQIAPESSMKVLYGMNAGVRLRAEQYAVIYSDTSLGHFPSGITFHVEHNNQSSVVSLPGVIGYQHVYPVLAAVALGSSLGFGMDEMCQSCMTLEHAPGRMRLIPAIKNTYCIDDTYNSSPIAVNEGLNTLSQIQIKGKKIAVLGDMMELGNFSSDAHFEAGKRVSEVCDMLLTVGLRSRQIAEGALSNGMDEMKIFQYEDSRSAGKELEQYLSSGDIVYIKGSQSLRMERVVEEIMAEPDRAYELLVRQETAWKKK